MSLLQDVLRSNTEEIDSGLKNIRLNTNNRRPSYEDKDKDKEDSDDDKLINVISLPGSPSRTRQSSPVRGASSRLVSKAPLLLSSNKTDPLRAFPTELTQRIFSKLSKRDLAKCALVCKKMDTPTTVWFQHYRKENFQDDSLPPGKWTKRESKQNWRQVYMKSTKDRSPTSTTFSRSGSGYNSPWGLSGYQTPREIKEEAWRAEQEVSSKPGKLEMREMYKDLGGRKSRSKTKFGSSGVRDKGGWDDGTNAW